MSSPIRTATAALSALPLLVSAAPEPASTLWSGLAELGGQTSFLQMRLAADAQSAEILRMEAMQGEPKWQALTLKRLDGRTIEFTLPAAMGSTPCRARIVGDELTPAQKSGCQLTLVKVAGSGDTAPTAAPVITPAVAPGLYRLADGRHVSVGWSVDFPHPVALDFSSGRWVFLFNRGAGRATAGPGMQVPLPVRLTLTARRIDGGDGLVWHEAGAKPVTGRRVTVEERPFVWTNAGPNGTVDLAGTLMLPPGKGPHPTVVLAPMSTDAPRDAYRQQAEYFLVQGMAALIYDKRGVGASKGDTKKTGMTDLADDAVAAVAKLKTVPELDARRIGVWGHSQGGWVAPIAAARSADIAFVVAQSGPSITAAEQEIYRVETSARNEGLSEAEIAEAGDYERRLMLWVKTGEGRDWIHEAARTKRNARWAHLVEFNDALPDLPSERSRNFWYYDPLPDYAKVKVPMLAVFGDRDGFVPTEKSARLLDEALRKAGNADYQITMLHNAAHGLWAGERDGGAGAARTAGFHADYFPTLTRWLEAHGLTARDPRKPRKPR